MLTFPFFPFQYNYYRPFYSERYKNNSNFQNINNENLEKREIENKGQEEIESNKNQKRSSKYNSFANINLSALLESDLNTPILEILGIKLYLDDLIILGLLFFLYKENVHDEILFVILLLLLLM